MTFDPPSYDDDPVDLIYKLHEIAERDLVCECLASCSKAFNWQHTNYCKPQKYYNSEDLKLLSHRVINIIILCYLEQGNKRDRIKQTHHEVKNRNDHFVHVKNCKAIVCDEQ